jgi:hypothetical protein
MAHHHPRGRPLAGYTHLRRLLQPRSFVIDEQTIELTFGNLLQRVIYHYWCHIGENLAIRQLLGHTDLPEFVGNLDDEAPYRVE